MTKWIAAALVAGTMAPPAQGAVLKFEVKGTVLSAAREQASICSTSSGAGRATISRDCRTARHSFTAPVSVSIRSF
jgi:hypothetical protein